ncbi:membrane protein containing DUF389 [Rhodopirellula maiorica SM1]|uniref:Membrane protein containing DUF389 n=1 Tax=Rhodopirellula maiorica SM1 TaxID=1265738 RepID=M5S596_9BACT|nr:DUF389 domain-containing protein [Rhodopirellula maiorica]EMI22812.1 membrane protein containing DUF389 [Rhodopirellula maiorica SM1]
MSLYFFVSSQRQLTEGTPWAETIADSIDAEIVLVVLGQDRSTLAEQARKTLQSSSTIKTIEVVDEDIDSVLNHIRVKKSSLVLIVKEAHDEPLQRSLFERSPVQTLWLRINGVPPTSSSQIFDFDGSTQSATQRIAKRLLGHSGQAPLLENDLPIDADNPKWLEQEAVRLETQRCQTGDMVWILYGRTPGEETRYAAARALMKESTQASIALISKGETFPESLASRLRYWSTHVAEPVTREQRVELSQSLTEGSHPSWEFLGLISASAMLAAFGLLQDSAAVIIGAMLIAPLMTPIVGAGLALTHGNRPLFQTASNAIVIGFLGALSSSFLFGCLVVMLQTPEVTPEMWARCKPSALDFCVGLVGGMAASYARTRSHLSSALAGAAIAAALVPPISTAGLQIAFRITQGADSPIWSSGQGTPIFGPVLLVSVNVLTIMMGSSFVLYARGMRVDRAFTVGQRWAGRMTILLVTLMLLVLVWTLGH